MAASSFASPPGLLHVTTSIVCCFCFHFFDLKEGEESFSSRRGKSETVQLQPSHLIKRIEFFGTEKKTTFFSFFLNLLKKKLKEERGERERSKGAGRPLL